MGKQTTQINFIRYADDTLIFDDASLTNVYTIKNILRSFELISRFKVNFHKKKNGATGVEGKILWRGMLVS